MGSTISRRQTTERLEKKTKEQRLLLDTIDTQVWYLTDIETYGQLNLSHSEFLGLVVKAIAHKRLEEFVSKEVAAVCKSSNIEVFQTKKPVHTEEWIPNADGEERLIAITKTPKLDTNGNVEYVVCAGTDITERVRVEEALVDARQRLENVLIGTKVGTWEWNIQTGQTVFNERWAEILGYTLEEISPFSIETWMNFCHPDDLAESERLLKDCFEGRSEYYICECRMKHKDGSWVWVLDHGKVFTWTIDGKPEWMYGSHQDITLRRNAEESLRGQRDFSESLIETAQALILVLDTQGRIVRFNPYMEKLTGYYLDEVKGKDWFETFLKPENGHTIKSLFQKALDDIQTRANVNPIITKNGRTILVEWYDKILKEKGGRTVGLLAIGHDITAQWHTELKLRESEAQKRAILDGISSNIALVDKKLKIIWANKTAAASVNRTPEEMIGHSCYSFWGDSVKPCPNCPTVKAFQTRKSEHAIMETPDGRIWEERGEPIPDKSGNVDFVIEIAHDITESKRAKEALRENKASVNAILEAFPGMLNAVDKDYNITNASKQLIEKAGYVSKEDVLGGKCYSIWKKREKICPECGVKQVLAEGKPLIRRCTLEEAELTGMQSDLYIAPVIDENGLATGAVEIMLDISDRLYAEKELRKSQNDLILTLSLIQDLVAIHQNGKIVDINQSGAELLGASSPEQIIGKFVTDFIETSKTAEANQRIEKLLKNGGRSPAYEQTIIGLDGTTRHVEVIGMPWTYNEQIAIKIVARDISERIRFQSQLHQSQKMEAVGTLAGGVAHDFNNLLQAINGYTQLLLMEKSGNDPDCRSLKAIEKAGLRASDLVRQLLQFSRKADSERNPVDLNQEIGQTKMILERTIPKMVRIETHLDDRLWTIIADEVQIEQILLNLGKNAADAMPDGGKLIIETENVVLDENNINKHLGAKAGRYVLLTVSDIGHGIDPETVEHIFDPFFTTKEIGKGTGLGLASVYGIVKSHGGYITCYSEVGQGTTFNIYFPARQQPAVEKTKDIDSQSKSHGTETILLVDDEQAIRGFAQQALMKFGYRILTASTGEEALEVYQSKSNEIDLVITDIGMPGMGGHKALKELLKINPAVKIIIASGYSINGQVKKSMKAGARGYVGKPYQLADLLNTVREVLNERL